MDSMFFNGWHNVLRVIIIGVCAYIGLIILLRISGKRTLSKMNAFDFVITIALGSTVATILLSKKVALSEGLTALGLLIFLQYLITWCSIRSRKFREIIKSTPSLLFYQGSFLNAALKKERITPEEIMAKARKKGIEDLSKIDAVILETDGNLSILTQAEQSNDESSSLSNVRRISE